MNTDSTVEWVVRHFAHVAVISVLLAAGAVIGRYYPPVVWWFFGIAGVAGIGIVAMFVMVLLADEIDHTDEGNYPGS